MFATLRPARVSARVPPHVFFLVSAVSRYLGPAFAVLLFALALLPATAAVIGVVVLRQTPTVIEVIGILLVMSGVAAHKEGNHE